MSGSVHTSARALELVVVAGSAGAVAVYSEIFGRLDSGLTAPVLLVQHRPADDSGLPELLRRRSAMKVRTLAPHQALCDGTIFVAPPDAQPRFVARRRLELDALREDGRPQADPLLTSAAAVYGPAVLAIVLSGRLEDGAAGIRAVKLAGGRVIVQDPRTAAQPSMPRAALATGCVDACLPPRSISDAIRAFVTIPGAAAMFASRPAPWAWLEVA